MKWLLRLEVSALLLVSGVLGFLGPFGTYLSGDLFSRTYIGESCCLARTPPPGR